MVSLSLAIVLVFIFRGGKSKDDHGRRLQSETEEITFNPAVFIFTGLIDLLIVYVIVREVGG